MEEKQLTIKNLQVNYKTWGEGKPLLILHGWRSNSGRWEKVAEILAQKGFLVVVPDIPGFGNSQEPSTAWTINDYVEWLVDFTAAVPALAGNFYLAGHSFGGTFAAKFAIKYNQRVEKLFLIAASCIRLRTPSKKFLYNVSRVVKIFHFFPWYETFRKYFYRFVLRRSDYLSVSGVMRQVYLNVINDDLSQKLISLRVPTILIWGEKDDMTPIEHARMAHGRIQRSQLLVIPGAGHNLHTFNAEELADKIIANI
jgi:pimeloyl-ACP methyl ester carboxylesterase